MFLGTYTPKVDDEGRFFLPAKFRDQLDAGLVITRGQDRCLVMYTAPEFMAWVSSITTAPATVKSVRDYQRMIASSASDERPDKQGRITIPPMLRAYAGLDKEIVVVGAINRVELWDSVAWSEYSSAQEDVFAELNEEVFPGSGA